jgi:hypothetical protein
MSTRSRRCRKGSCSTGVRHRRWRHLHAAVRGAAGWAARSGGVSAGLGGGGGAARHFAHRVSVGTARAPAADRSRACTAAVDARGLARPFLRGAGRPARGSAGGGPAAWLLGGGAATHARGVDSALRGPVARAGPAPSCSTAGACRLSCATC